MSAVFFWLTNTIIGEGYIPPAVAISPSAWRIPYTPTGATKMGVGSSWYASTPRPLVSSRLWPQSSSRVSLRSSRATEYRTLLHHHVIINSVTDKISTVLSVSTTEGPALKLESLEDSNREHIPPPRTAFDFLLDLMGKTDPDLKPRNDVNPLHVVQPDGVSFKIDGNTLAP
ncbi:hypothetical protein BV22DRAFT_1134070 [Leucogyrophana mollusca]|uniref:Uncharacterized protein n=1 Tax=Leucogyrophana mollusca TaxID=85980 RepID=A0ACB8B0E0_9AGAM|nr:hypothetical protein BV22DRAFT_1134070 [Leucogyrophana mollusca]